MFGTKPIGWSVDIARLKSLKGFDKQKCHWEKYVESEI